MSTPMHPSLADGDLELDVRPLLAGGKDPFGTIMQIVGTLAPGQGLALRAPFEPRPLFGILASKGYQARAIRLDEEDWVIEFLPQTHSAPALHLDVRGLEPPEPMVQILAACENLSPGQSLEVTHDRRPQMLYPVLHEKGLQQVTEERADGQIHVRITRPLSPLRP